MNVVLPEATPWLPTKECLAALSGLEAALDPSELTPDVSTLARLSSKVAVDLAKVSDDDLIALRRNEELFSTWRRFVAELCLEVDWLAIENAFDVRTFVQAKEVLWRAALDRQIGRSGVPSGLFDASAVVCGVITAGLR